VAATAAATVLATLAALTAAAPLAVASPPGNTVRFATFNASLNRNVPGRLIADLSTPGNVQASNVAEIIQRERPDVLLINEFDYDSAGTALRLFQTNYLSMPHNGAGPIAYPYAFTAPSNTGIASGHDLNNNGVTNTVPNTPGYGDDALGFGDFPGQFGMAVYSKYPIDEDAVRTFQHFLWKDMPGNRMPPGWYDAQEQAILPVSSKSHWDLPIGIGNRTVHFLVSHPTPPVFDGPEDRNGRRNADEIRLWADYITPGAGGYIYDDAGVHGGLAPGESFVIAGDQNSDPLDGDSIPGAIQQLLENPLVNTHSTPTSPGAVEQNALQGGANLTHKSDPKFDTADFADSAPGNLRADYVLPRKNVKIIGSGVFWPLRTDPLFRLVGVFPFPTSDHRLVWVDVKAPGADDEEEDN
jgi:3-phytase